MHVFIHNASCHYSVNDMHSAKPS